MARAISTINSSKARLIASFVFTLMIMSGAARAQNPYDNGTPAEAKGGASWFSAYAPDKLENVNLANGNFMVNIPLATVGGRGSASYTVTLSHHSKMWTSRHDPEVITDPLGGRVILHHFRPDYGDGVETLPNEITLGGGWFILKAPAIKINKFGIEARLRDPNQYGYKYVLTKVWLVLPDGSEIEMRDEATQGAPALTPGGDGYHPLTDRDRGRVWKSVDGSAITYVTDNNNGASNFLPAGWVFMPDGTRFRIDGIPFAGGSGRCAKIIDRNGNYINIEYDTPTAGDVTYTDQLGRQVVLQGGTGGATVTVKEYNGLADRVYSVETARIGATDGSGNPINMRSDYWSVQRPIIAGDYLQAYEGTIEHTHTEPHTDLFYHGENGTIIDDIVVPTKLIMPDGRFFTFRYDMFALLAEIAYPGGGKTQIDYTGEFSEVCEILSAPYANDINRRVTQRRILSNGTTVDAVWLYNTGSFEVRQGSSTGPLLMAETHHFLALNAEYRRCYSYGNDALDYGSDGTMYPIWENAKEYKVEWQTGSGLLTETRNWAQRAPVVWAPDPGSGVNDYAARYGQEQPSNDDRVTREDNVLENGKLKRVEYDYDNFNNVTLMREYDYGTNPNPGPLIRETTRSYAMSLNGSCYSSLNPSDPGCDGGIAADINSIIHLRRLTLQESVWDKTTNQEQARATYEYDIYADDGNHATMVDYASVTGHDAAWSASRAARGNVTQIGKWLKESNTYLYTYPRYDEVGNAVATKDPRGVVSSVSFADDFGNGDNPGGGVAGNFGTTYAFPTLFTSPPPNPGAAPHTARAQYDFSRGTQTGFKDRNNIITKTEYNDPFNRPTKVIVAKGVAGVETHTGFYYAPNNVYGVTLNSNDVMVVKDRDVADDAILRSWTLTDGFGRTVEDWTRHPQGDVKVTTVYDGLGRAIQISNLYRNGEAPVYTTTTYDLAGRVNTVVTPDGAHVDTAYSGNQVTVTDQAGKKRSSETDALGRLVLVIEDPGGLGHETSYLYDALGNLRQVTQGAQTRWFAYDSLSRLIRAKNPEQDVNSNPNMSYTDPVTGHSGWSMAYSYDPNGNLTERRDARNVVTKYYYDALNRNFAIDYINGSQVSNVRRIYDGAVNGKGRLYYDSTQVGGVNDVNATHMAIDSYDAPGRPLQKRQHYWQGAGWGPAYTVQQTYDLAGNVKTMTYPSGRTVKYSYDQSGRLSSFSGSLGGSPATYADTISYNPAGQMIKERFGTNTSLYHNQHYNNRLQLVDTRLGDSIDEWSWSRGAISFFYGTTAANSWNLFANDTDNNGNLRRQDHFVPLASGGYVTPQDDVYTYDALNRVSSFTEAQIDSGGHATLNVASQDFNYDRYGNRWITSARGGVSNYNPTYDTTNNTNRIMGLGYDAAGNITSDPMTGGLMTYDPENRMLTATNGGVSGSYTYNADGRRVRRIAGGQETWQIYGIGGELLAEYAAGAVPSAPQKEYGYRGGNLLVIAEPWSGGNLAWGKATSQSSTSFGGNSSRGVDGNTNGNWDDNSVTNTNNEHQPWWQVDLGSVQQIGTVRLWNRTDCCGDRLSNFNVLVSDNPFSSTDLTTTINQAGVSRYYTAGPAGLLTDIGVGRSGRYVRVQLAGDNYLSLAEVEVMGGTASGEGVKWLVQDHLGSTRMVVDRSGSLGGVRRHDFAPFGEDLGAGIGIRSAALGYGADSTRQKFTGKERDDEAGLDYFLARYHSPVQGRLTSVDPENAGADPELPQTWNGYSYAINNPLTYSDPDGLKVKICDTNGNCTDISDEDARKYFFNKNYQKQVGYYVDRGKVYDSNNNLIGTYLNICCDSLPAWNAGVLHYTAYVLRDPRVWVGAAVGATVGAVIGQSGGGNTSSVRPKLSTAEMSGTLREAAKKKGNFGIGTATRQEAQLMGEAWVGPGHRVASDGKTLISADGLRQYRPPSNKPKLGKEQANFEWRSTPGGRWTGNGHLDTQ